MYNRDAVAEMKDVLGRLAESMDRLAEVHAKDRTGNGDANKELLEWLKKNGGSQKVDEVPVSDARADDLKIKRTKETKGTEEQSINYSTIRDVNAAFRALQGDLGGFQRTLVNAIKWGKDGQSYYEKIRGITPETMPRPVADTSKAVEMIDKLGTKEGLKAFFDLPYTGKGSPAAAAGGGVANQAAANRVAAAVNNIGVNGKPMLVPPIPPGYPGYNAAGAAAATSMSQWATMATAAAVAAAPMILSKLAIHTSDNVINETRSRFGNLDAKIATGLATYDLSRLMNNLEMAPKIADSFTKVLKSREELNKTLLPIETAASNVWNNIVTSFNKAANFLLTPVSQALSGGGKEWGILNPKNFFIGGPDVEKQMEALKKAKDMNIFEDSNFVNIGIRLRDRRLAMDKEQEVLDELASKTPPGGLALSIKRTPIAPPRRFVN